jgi:hypothetical protein
VGRGISEKQLRKAELWVSRSMLIIDEISMISGAVLNETLLTSNVETSETDNGLSVEFQ